MASRQIHLEVGEAIQISFLPARIAEALHDDESIRNVARKKIAAELAQMVDDGALAVRDPLTLEQLVFERGDVPGYAVVTADDLRRLLEPMGVIVHHGGSKQIHISAQHTHISVDDAITLIIDAVDCPNDIGEDDVTALEQLAVNVQEKFLSACAKLDIFPRFPFDPEDEYTGEEGQQERFRISLEEFERYAADYGVVVVLMDDTECISSDGRGYGPRDEDTQTRPKLVSQAREEVILSMLRSRGYDPLALPRWESSKPGVKAEVRRALGNKGMWTGATVFDKAWERLSANGDIAYRK